MLELELAGRKQAEQHNGGEERRDAGNQIGRELAYGIHKCRNTGGEQNNRQNIKRGVRTLSDILNELYARRSDHNAAHQRHYEYRPPAKQRAHKTADHGPKRRPQRNAGTAQAQIQTELLARGARQHHVHHEREQDARSRSLQNTTWQQNAKRRSDQAQDFAGDHASACEKQQLARRETAGQEGHDGRKNRRHDHVARDEPLCRGGTHRKGCHNVVQRHVNDVLVKRGNKGCNIHYDENRRRGRWRYLNLLLRFAPHAFPSSWNDSRIAPEGQSRAKNEP